MGSSFKLKNGKDQEFSIVHNDNAGAITVASDKIVVKDVNGNVGIGTSSPDTTYVGETVHITNTLNTGTISDNSGLIVESVNRNSRLIFKNNNDGAIYKSDSAGVLKSVLLFDSVGNVLLTSGSGLGYGTGTGGTVIQATSKSTAVTLNKPSGQITMNNAALAAGASIEFNLNNSLIQAGTTVMVNPVLVNTIYRTEIVLNTSGIVVIRVTNTSASSQSDALSIYFNIIKGAVA